MPGLRQLQPANVLPFFLPAGTQRTQWPWGCFIPHSVQFLGASSRTLAENAVKDKADMGPVPIVVTV